MLTRLVELDAEMSQLEASECSTRAPTPLVRALAHFPQALRHRAVFLLARSVSPRDAVGRCGDVSRCEDGPQLGR